jgi:hypothetical protein
LTPGEHVIDPATSYSSSCARDRAVVALPDPGLVPRIHRDARGPGVHHWFAGQSQSRLYSFGEGADKAVNYDAHPIEHMSHSLTMLAYEMNDGLLSFGHGAPLRLRNENELGFKQVEWIKDIEFVTHYAEIGSGYGGYNQDHEFLGYR